MGQGQSSAGLGSSDEGTNNVITHDIMQMERGAPNLLTDRVRQCLDTDDMIGTSENAISSPMAEKVDLRITLEQG